MAIFVDPDGKADNQDGKTANPWPELEPKKVRVKENVRAATKMAGTTLKGKKGSATSKATPKFSIFVDPEGEEDEKHEEERREVHLPSAQSFVPFVDPEERARVPATPKFVPFRDEVRLTFHEDIYILTVFFRPRHHLQPGAPCQRLS